MKELKSMNAVELGRYKPVIENVASEDGGGFRIYFPTLGYAVYGVGDTVDEALDSLRDSTSAFNAFVSSNPEYQVPQPTASDLEYWADRQEIDDPHAASNNFAYAA